MSLDAEFARIAEKVVREMADRAQRAIEREASRPSVRLRPLLEHVEVPPAGVKVYDYFQPGEYQRNGYGAKRVYTGYGPCWRASLHELVAYGKTPEKAYDEFDLLFEYNKETM